MSPAIRTVSVSRPSRQPHRRHNTHRARACGKRRHRHVLVLRFCLSVEPAPGESPSSSPHASTAQSPTDLPEFMGNVAARPSAEPAPVSAASDLGQGGDCISRLPSEITTGSGHHGKCMKATLAARTEPRVTPPVAKVSRPSKVRWILGVEVVMMRLSSSKKGNHLWQKRPAPPAPRF
jgi:hypothetical protein